MTEARPIRVFVVDDHELVRSGLREAVAATGDMEWSGEAGSVQEALSAIAAADLDVALLDVRLPDGDGIELCREVKARHPEIRCVMLTSFGGEDAVYDAIVAGASGYLLKGMRVRELVDAVRKVAEGHSLLDPAVTQRVLDRLRRREDETPDHRLTPQEERILEAIIEGRSNRQIASSLNLAEQTVKNYVSSLLSKLGVSSRTQAAVYGTQRGMTRKDQLN